MQNVKLGLTDASLAALVVAGIWLALTMPMALADTVSSSASVTNAAPTVGTVTATTPVTLSSGSTVIAWCNATITDTNGYSDVSAVNATIYHSTSSEGASDDNNDHYTNSSCVTAGGSGTTINANCTFTLQYYANANSWTCKMYANDTAGLSGSSTASVTVNNLTGLSVPSTIAFGELALAATSSVDINHTVTNYGNTQLDIQLSGTDAADNTANAFNCTIGTVPVGNTKYNVTQYAQDYTANMTALTGSAVTRTEFDLAQRTSEVSASTAKTYWKTKMPTTGVGGSCAGKLIFGAVAG